MNKSSGIGKILNFKGLALPIVAVVVIVFFQILNHNYLNAQNVAGIMTTISISGILAVGISCLLISGAVDLAAGAEACFAGVIVAVLLRAGLPWPLAFILTLLSGALFGVVNAFLSNVLYIMPFIATIGMSSVYKGLALWLANSENVAISNAKFYALSSWNVGIIPGSFIMMAVLFVIYGCILSRTKFGRYIYICGGNRQAARLAGISLKKVSTILFINCGVLSAFGGAIMSSRNHLGQPTAIIGTEMAAIAAAVLGGVSFMGGAGNMGGCFIGLILINAFNNGLNFVGLQAYWQIVAQGALLLIALMADYFNEKARTASLKDKADAAQSAQ
jgi:ribose/xylose/arabinose/galactoside ABC-type transport system permease subunit